MVKSHVECSSELVWQCVKKNNAYVRASVNRTRFSAERGNVTSKHGFSSSGATQIFFAGIFRSFFWRHRRVPSLRSSSREREKEGKRKELGPLFSLLSSLFSLLFSLSLSLSLSLFDLRDAKCQQKSKKEDKKRRKTRG